MTTNQHLVITDIPTENLEEIKDLLAKYKLDNLSQSALRQSSSACVAFPTCGLAMAESERVSCLVNLFFEIVLTLDFVVSPNFG